MEMMKAFVRTGATDQEVVLREVPVPEVGAEEVLVRIEAFGVGIHDRYFIPKDAAFPYVIGTEGAGIIIHTGDKVDHFATGDRVAFTTVLQPQGGTWAEYAVVDQNALFPIPDGLNSARAATVPIAGETALQCMRVLNLNKGDRLFIAGASGAIGTFVIQLAAAKGISISASASEKNHAYMQSLGVDKAVDYHDTDWQNEVITWADGGVAAALAIQPGTGTDSMNVVKDGGRLITVSGDSAQVVPERGISVQQMGHDSDTQRKMADLVNAIAEGDIRAEIEKLYPFEQALGALKKTETRHARGKLVVKGMKTQQYTEAVNRYLQGLNEKDLEGILSLYADNATVEDPVGSSIVSGKEDLRAFYTGAVNTDLHVTRTGPVRIAGFEAAFPFQLHMNINGISTITDVIDLFRFDDEDKVISMRAFHGPDNRRVTNERSEWRGHPLT